MSELRTISEEEVEAACAVLMWTSDVDRAAAREMLEAAAAARAALPGPDAGSVEDALRFMLVVLTEGGNGEGWTIQSAIERAERALAALGGRAEEAELRDALYYVAETGHFHYHLTKDDAKPFTECPAPTCKRATEVLGASPLRAMRDGGTASEDGET